MSDSFGSFTGSLRTEDVYSALCALTPECADALMLRIFGGLTTAEAAQVMGVSETVIKTLVCQAVRDLRETIVNMNGAGP